MVETIGLPAIEADGRLSEDALESCIVEEFGLNGGDSGSGP